MNKNRNAVLVIILISYLMIVLDISIVITALPKIKQDLGFSNTELSWLQNAYTLTFGGLLLLGARAGDILGRRRMFTLGLWIFTLSSIAIGLAQFPAWILTARATQGIGAAILAPSTLSLLTTYFPEGRERTRAVGYYGATAGVGASLGLVMGGFLAGSLTWRMGFFLNLPIGMGLIWAANKYLQETETKSGDFDLIGALCSTLGMAALVYGLVRSASAGWQDNASILSLVVGVILLVLLLLNEKSAKQPIMPLRLFTDRSRSGAYGARMFFLGGMVGFWFFTTQFLQDVLGFTPLEAGAAFLPMTVVNFATALTVPKFTRLLGNEKLLLIGLVITTAGMAWLSLISSDTHYLTGVALPMMVIGIGQGWTLSPLTVAGIARVDVSDAGAASGIVNMVHQLGGSLGLAILVVIFSSTKISSPDIHIQIAERTAHSITGATLMLAISLVLTILFTSNLQLCWRPNKHDNTCRKYIE